MKQLEKIEKGFNSIELPQSKYLPVEIALEDSTVIVCGKTDKAIEWAEKFLKNGYITAIQFKEIPKQLYPYRLNIRYVSDDFKYGDRLNNVQIVAIATGDKELDQILASKYHSEQVNLIMSETPSRFVNLRFPEDNNEIISLNLENSKNDSAIKVGILKSKLENDSSYESSFKELKKNFPDFNFELVPIKDFDTESYNLNNQTFSFNSSFQEEINNSYDRGYNALFNEDIDLILVDGKDIPNFYSPDVEFWPTLVERKPAIAIMIAPKEFNTIYDIPDKHKVFIEYLPYKREFNSLLYHYYKKEESEERKYPEFERFRNYKTIQKIIEDNPNAVIIMSFSSISQYKLPESNRFLKDHNYKINFPPFAPITLDGFIVGISKRDNTSSNLKKLKIASQKVYPEQSSMFTFEQYYKNRLAPVYEHYIGFSYSGAFLNDDNKFRFDGFTENDHGDNHWSNSDYKETMEEAVKDMLNFIDVSLRFW